MSWNCFSLIFLSKIRLKGKGSSCLKILLSVCVETFGSMKLWLRVPFIICALCFSYCSWNSFPSCLKFCILNLVSRPKYRLGCYLLYVVSKYLFYKLLVLTNMCFKWVLWFAVFFLMAYRVGYRDTDTLTLTESFVVK